MPFRPADNSPFRRHYAPMGATRRSLLCLCMCDGFSIAHRRENARIIAEAPPVAEKARRFRGSVPVFTPQRGWKPADTTVFRIAEAPPVAYFSQQCFLFVSDGILFVNSRKSGQKPDTPPQQNARPRSSLRGRLPYVIYSPRRRVQRCTSSMVGIDGAAPGRDTATAAARDARSRHSSSGRPAAIQATK